MNFRFLLSLLFLLNLGLIHNSIAQDTSSIPLIDIAKALKEEALFNNDGRDNFFSILTHGSTVSSFKEEEITLALYPKDLAWMKIENPKLYQEYLSAHPMLTEVFESTKAGDNLILLTFEVGKVK